MNWYKLYEETETRPVINYSVSGSEMIIHVDKYFNYKGKDYFPDSVLTYDVDNKIYFIKTQGVFYIASEESLI